MKFVSIALSAISALCCLQFAPSATASSSRPPLAVYYSFDFQPPAVAFGETQSELTRILAPSGLRAAWRSSQAPSAGEDFPGIVVFRFTGRCFFENDREEAGLPLAGLPLAETQISDGHVLPFGSVNCDRVRRLIAPSTRFLTLPEKNVLLGKALARVTAHEIYHMLTGSETHARDGIARSAHSRGDLTDTAFTFARDETDWLRAWTEQQTPSSAQASDDSAVSTLVNSEER